MQNDSLKYTWRMFWQEIFKGDSLSKIHFLTCFARLFRSLVVLPVDKGSFPATQAFVYGQLTLSCPRPSPSKRAVAPAVFCCLKYWRQQKNLHTGYKVHAHFWRMKSAIFSSSVVARRGLLEWFGVLLLAAVKRKRTNRYFKSQGMKELVSGKILFLMAISQIIFLKLCMCEPTIAAALYSMERSRISQNCIKSHT